jgi:predicted transcriptional regulator
MSISLRMSAEVSKRVRDLAALKKTSPHAFMLEAIGEKLELEERALAFQKEATARLKSMKKTGLGLDANEVFSYLQAHLEGTKAKRPKVKKLL